LRNSTETLTSLTDPKACLTQHYLGPCPKPSGILICLDTLPNNHRAITLALCFTLTQACMYILHRAEGDGCITVIYSLSNALVSVR